MSRSAHVDTCGLHGHFSYCSADVSACQCAIVCIKDNVIQHNVCCGLEDIFTSHVPRLRVRQQWGDNNAQNQAQWSQCSKTCSCATSTAQRDYGNFYWNTWTIALCGNCVLCPGCYTISSAGTRTGSSNKFMSRRLGQTIPE